MFPAGWPEERWGIIKGKKDNGKEDSDAPQGKSEIALRIIALHMH
jgi:hypothetical protein